MQTILSSRIMNGGSSSYLGWTFAKRRWNHLTLLPAPLPPPTIKGKRCRLTLLPSSQTIPWERHFVLFWLPSQGVGAAHLQTPAGLNGDSCMQRDLLTARLVQGEITAG
jgi:hypothetical protein